MTKSEKLLPSLIVWDFNGTILDDGHILVEVNNEMNRERGLKEISYDYYRVNFDHPPKPFYEAIGYDFSKEDYAEISRQFLERYELSQRSASLSPHVKEIIERLWELGILQIIMSAHQEDMLRRHAENLGIAKYFSHISGESSSVIGGKVERAKALAESGRFDFSSAILIGDTIHDYHTAKAMGADCILYSGGHQNLERLQAAGVPIIDDFSQLKNIFSFL